MGLERRNVVVSKIDVKSSSFRRTLTVNDEQEDEDREGNEVKSKKRELFLSNGVTKNLDVEILGYVPNLDAAKTVQSKMKDFAKFSDVVSDAVKKEIKNRSALSNFKVKEAKVMEAKAIDPSGKEIVLIEKKTGWAAFFTCDMNADGFFLCQMQVGADRLGVSITVFWVICIMLLLLVLALLSVCCLLAKKLIVKPSKAKLEKKKKENEKKKRLERQKTHEENLKGEKKKQAEGVKGEGVKGKVKGGTGKVPPKNNGSEKKDDKNDNNSNQVTEKKNSKNTTKEEQNSDFSDVDDPATNTDAAKMIPNRKMATE